MLCSTCILAQSVLVTNQTVSLINERSIKPQSIFNQLIEHVSSNPVHSMILNIMLGFYLVYANVIDQGCKLPNGLRVPNGWEKLYNNCQEKCVCRRNKFQCSPSSCDLNQNECTVDSFGEEYCQGALLVLYSGSNTIYDFARLINLNGLILLFGVFDSFSYRNVQWKPWFSICQEDLAERNKCV